MGHRSSQQLTPIPATPNKAPLDIDWDGMVNSANKSAQATAKYTPSAKTVNMSTMSANRNPTDSRSGLWAAPAPVPSYLFNDTSSMSANSNPKDSRSDLWAAPAPVPSYLFDETSNSALLNATDSPPKTPSPLQPTTKTAVTQDKLDIS